MQTATHTTAPAPQLACFAAMDKHFAEKAAAPKPKAHKPWVNAAARRTTLAKLGCFWQQDLDDTSLRGRMKVLRTLDAALARDRRASEPTHHLHWTYNLNRHRSTLAAYHAERMAIDALFVPMPSRRAAA
jgi:hypothetical protein